MEENKDMAVVEQRAQLAATSDTKADEMVTVTSSNVIEKILYVTGIALIIFAVVKYGNDLETYRGEFRFNEIGYVGGDAYNYIISATRSAAVMVKSLILAVLGCSAVISGLLIRISNRK